MGGGRRLTAGRRSRPPGRGPCGIRSGRWSRLCTSGAIVAALGLALCFAWNAVSFGAVLISLAAMQAADLYATEAARAALGVAFDNMGLPKIWSMTAVLNEPSQAVMRRLGLTETTRFDHPRIPPGDPLRPQVAYHGARPA
jgi:Acetyltransferase (GNAT) domain